jgi:holo-[acyl-carrier protein] synthase
VIVGIGLDVVAVARLERLLGGTTPAARAERFLDRCFTATERAYCDARRDRATRYAARFAAKEAVVKALGAPAGVRWTDIEVSRAEGAPQVRLAGAAEQAARQLEVDAVHLTLTHDGGVAAAAVVLESRRRG